MIDIAERLTAQTAVMGMEGPVFFASRHEVPIVKLGLFFNELIKNLKAHEEARDERFTTESQKLAHDALFMV